MAAYKKIQAGSYRAEDGRLIEKQGSGWFIYSKTGSEEFGPLTTLKSAKHYIETGSVELGQHKITSKYGRKKSRKEFNAYLAAEANKGNYAPVVITIVVLFAAALLMEALKAG